MADSIIHSTEGFVEKHPYATAGIGIGVILFIWYISSGSTPTTAAAPDDTDAAAEALGAAQLATSAQTAQASIAANASTQQASIAAGVANTSTAAQQAVDIATVNASSAQAQTAANAEVGVAGDNTLSSEFAALASVLTNYSNNAVSEGQTNAGLTENVLSQAIGASNTAQTNQFKNEQAAATSESNDAGLGGDFSALLNTIYGIGKSNGGTGYPTVGASSSSPASGGQSSTTSTGQQVSTTASIVNTVNPIIASIGAGNIINAGAPTAALSSALTGLIAQVGNDVAFNAG